MFPTSAEQRRRITSTDLLTALFDDAGLVGTRLHCWVMVNMGCTNFPGYSSEKPHFRQSVPSMHWCLGLCPATCRILPCPLLNLLRLLLAHFCNLSRSLSKGWNNHLLVNHIFQFCIFCRLDENSLYFIIQTISEVLELYSIQYQPL